jgi:hypothetical protein
MGKYWRLALLPFVLGSLWTAHVCVTQFEGTRRVIVVSTVLMITLAAALWLLLHARRMGVMIRPSRYRDVLARTYDYLTRHRRRPEKHRRRKAGSVVADARTL